MAGVMQQQLCGSSAPFRSGQHLFLAQKSFQSFYKGPDSAVKCVCGSRVNGSEGYLLG